MARQSRPVIYDWPMTRGDDETLVIEYPASVDPADLEFRCQIRTVSDFVLDPTDVRLIAECTPVIDGQDVSLPFTHDQTLLLKPKTKYWWSVRQTDPDTGEITNTVMRGEVIVWTAATELE